MKIIDITKEKSKRISELLSVWESSVKSTHLFLTRDDIDSIKRYVPDAINSIQHLVVVENDNDNDEVIGFMGINGKTLEMLFVSNNYRGQGLGKQLMEYGIEVYSVSDLNVNEQNPSARGFYEHMGFVVDKRMELDDQGNNFPILHMKKY